MMVKICGIRRHEDLMAAARSGCDMVGFVTGFPEAYRNLSLKEACELSSRTPEPLMPVVVCPAENQELIENVLREATPYAVQLHGEGNVRVRGVKVIRAIGVAERLDATTIIDSVSRSDFVLADSSRGGLGGTGKTHDWQLSRMLRDMIHPKPLILAGGLTPENVCEAINIVHPYGVDVSSGVESSPGVKDADRMRLFVARAKGCRP